MRLLTLLSLALLPLHASASPELCMRKVEAKYLECHNNCGQMGAPESIDCIRGCAIGYNMGKRECQRGSLAFEPQFLISHCKQVMPDNDGNTYVCTVDGKRYPTRAWCNAYCN